LEFLDELELPYRLNPYLVRGLDYYTGPIFEVFAEKGIGSIAGGGRYDKMIGESLESKPCAITLECPMSNKQDSFWDGLLKVGAAIGGAWLFLELYRKIVGEYYICPNCNQNFDEKYASRCPHCNVKLKWLILWATKKKRLSPPIRSEQKDPA
jgi:hypothetical protein